MGSDSGAARTEESGASARRMGVKDSHPTTPHAESSMSRSIACRLFPAAALAAVVAATSAFVTPSALVEAGVNGVARFGPPWISIEYPPSPYDRVTREALLLVN